MIKLQLGTEGMNRIWFIVKISTNLPGHLLLLHDRLWIFVPAQVLPPLDGAGWLHVLLRCCSFPLPHATRGHPDHKPHVVQAPSTRKPPFMLIKSLWQSYLISWIQTTNILTTYTWIYTYGSKQAFVFHIYKIMFLKY